MRAHLRTSISFGSVVFSLLWFAFTKPVKGERVFAPLPRNYPHPVRLNYNTDPLFCSRGSVGWADKLLAFKDLPSNAAGGVVHSVNETQAILWWEHPIFDPVSERYMVNLYAQSMSGMNRIGRKLAVLTRPINKTRSERGFGRMGVYLGGETNNDGDAFLDTTWSLFSTNPGGAIDIYLETSGCPNWLATYTVLNQ